MSTMTADDAVTPAVDAEPVARPSLFHRLTAPRPSMPDCVRWLPVPNMRNLVMAGGLTVCKPLSE